jgi:hypothetical protein
MNLLPKIKDKKKIFIDVLMITLLLAAVFLLSLIF